MASVIYDANMSRDGHWTSTQGQLLLSTNEQLSACRNELQIRVTLEPGRHQLEALDGQESSSDR